MKIALVHDYLKEYGGAERVLKTLSEIYPKAPIYTAFRVKGSTADIQFRDKKIIESWLAPILKIGKLYSPLRFLIPVIWGSFDLSEYDLIITSSSWYITRGFKVGPKTKVVCYCHTPPRWLYGYETSVGFTRYLPVKIYAAVVGHFLRIFDFKTAQKINLWIANSKNVAQRIKKFYRKDSIVIYPPVEVKEIIKTTRGINKKDFYLVVSRLVGAKGIETAAETAISLGVGLKIVGEAHGFSDIKKKLERTKKGKVELLGYVDDDKKYKLMAQAKAFIALARDEDFGMTVVEAQAAGTPVIAFNGGGFEESVISGKTGVLIDEITMKSMKESIKKVEYTRWRGEDLINNAKRFSKEKFTNEINGYIEKHA
ncbi:glycosyltransferase [Patescibacteria group bacterium]